MRIVNFRVAVNAGDSQRLIARDRVLRRNGGDDTVHPSHHRFKINIALHITQPVVCRVV